MNFPIYSVGDSAFLEQVLISVAMVSGSGSITAIASIGLLIGVLVMGFSSVMDGGKAIPFEQLLVGWILYACAFYPTATVVIEDNYTGSVRPVANVPLGVAASGFVVSSLGYKLTSLFEQGYGFIAPSVTTTYFAEPLELITKLRSNARNPSIMDAMDSAISGGNGNLRKSWDNYIRECTVTGIDLEEKNLNNLMSEALPEALKFESRTFGTRLYLTNSVGQDYNCTDAYGALINATKIGVMDERTDNAFRALIVENATQTHQTAAGKIDDALSMLGAVSNDSYEYMMAAILEPIYEDAAIGRYQDVQDMTSAVMLNQAIQQRNTQWAAEQSMFMSVVRPMQTFFEGFVYAVTPMLAVLIVMGRFGIGLAGKYLQTIFWVQLWMPILSIVNLYITTAASGQMSSYLASNELTSMYSLNGIDHILETWIAAGGMLAASTPVISFFLISGSAYAFTSIAGKLGGADHLDEKTSSPDALKQGPVTQAQAFAGHDSFSGTQRSGVESLIGGMSLNQSLGKSVSSASANQEQATEAFSRQLTQTFGATSSASETRSRQEALGRAVMAMSGQGATAVQNAAKAHVQQHGTGAESLEAVTGQKALQFMTGGNFSLSTPSAPGGGGPKAGFSMGVTGSTTATDQNTRSSKEGSSDNQGFEKKASFGDESRASFANELAHKFADTSDKSWQSGLSQADTTALGKTAQDTVTATETYSSISQLSQGAGTASNLNYKELGAAIENNPKAREALNNEMMHASPEIRQKANEREAQFKSVYKLSSGTARSAAQIATLAESNDVGNIKSAVAIAQTATSSGMSTDADPYRNQGLTNNAPQAGVARAAAQGVKGGEAARGVDGVVAGKQSEAISAGNLPVSSRAVENEHGQNIRGVANAANQFDEQITSGMTGQAYQRLQDAADFGTSTQAKIFGGSSGLIDAAKEHTKQQAIGLTAGILGTYLYTSKAVDGAKSFFTGLEEADAAGESARNTYIDEHREQLGQMMTEAYQNKYGLTDTQARVFASNFSTNNIDKEQAQAALRSEYQDPNVADNMIKVLGYASGDVNQAGSYLQHVQNINRLQSNIGPTVGGAAQPLR